MTDIKSALQRSENMSAIKRADTKPELFIRKLLFSAGYRYRVQRKDIPGHPDIWMKKYNVAIFVNGCFWHRHQGCRLAYMPKSHMDFWSTKFHKNIQRDKLVREQLKQRNIRCLTIWECSIRKAQKKSGDPLQLINAIEDFIKSDKPSGEI